MAKPRCHSSNTQVCSGLQLQVEREARRAASGGTAKLPINETGDAYYRKFILEDLKPWAIHGITKVRHGTTNHLSKLCIHKGVDSSRGQY